MDIQKILAYADNARDLLHRTLAEHPQTVNREFETMAAHATIHALVAHMASAEERWGHYLAGTEPGPRYESIAPDDIEEVFGHWDAVRANTWTIINGPGGADLQRTISIKFPHLNFETEMSVEDVLFQVCNHQTYHIGQISTTLQRFNVDPANFDYALLK